MHKWRPRPLHECQNAQCNKWHNRPGKYCSACQKRKERSGTFAMAVHPKKVCQTPACRSAIRAFDRCSRCHQLWKQGIDPDRFHRPYRRLCNLDWCSNYAKTHGYCDHHLRMLKKLDDQQKAELHQQVPAHCTETNCEAPVEARGVCQRHLFLKAKSVILLREYWPNLPGHVIRNCIGKPLCTRKAILFGRCPDCLYDWQFSLTVKRNFFKKKA